MIYDLFLFGAMLSRGGFMQPQFATNTAIAAQHVALDLKPLYGGDDARFRTAKILMVMAGGESKGDPLVLGDCIDSKIPATCAAHGPLQIHPDVWGAFLERAGIDYTGYFDTETSMRGAVHILHSLKDVCVKIRPKMEPLRCALYAYASGSYDGTPLAKRAMDKRCQIAGGCQ